MDTHICSKMITCTGSTYTNFIITVISGEVGRRMGLERSEKLRFHLQFLKILSEANMVSTNIF